MADFQKFPIVSMETFFIHQGDMPHELKFFFF